MNKLSRVQYELLVDYPTLCSHDLQLDLQLTVLWKGETLQKSIRFNKYNGIKYTTDYSMTTWHISTLGFISEVSSSAWVASLEASAQERDPRPLGRHFIVALDEWGALEVIADSFENETEGLK